MNTIKLFNYLGLFLGSVFVITGSAVLIFNITPAYLPGEFKNMMAVVLILYGVYRIVVSFYKNKREENSND
jgi:cadmium resistance protein CadD (predicted permease)